ncbi:hypothetical protein [Azohydromonas aeria]|uniref:hypothetical protein n=1 Tax=Azohydromonas aeria TaxID=2590212 RepID=UPI0012F98DA1|nr:hypothetical protein [Azohydromonas aeria]
MTYPHIHHFGNDALSAVCNEAMGRVLQPIDIELACRYFQEADWIAEGIGRRDPDSHMPGIFTRLSPLLEDRCSWGACQTAHTWAVDTVWNEG